jgi:hypothetical protein
MSIATKLNDIIALSQSTNEKRSPELLTEDDLSLVFGGNGNGFAASDAAFQQQQDAQARFDIAVQNGVEALGNLEMGSATRHASEALNAYGELQAATQNLHNAVDSDVANAHTQQQIDAQIANGHNYSPADANMTNADGSPGVGDSY